MTVHNLAFQGQFPHELLAALGLPPQAFAIDGVEYYGSIGFLKAGLALADRITTVSPTYAGEIRTPDGGMGLDGLLRERAAVLSGILNGIDTDGLGSGDRSAARRALRRRTLPRRVREQERAAGAASASTADPGALLFGVVSRLTWQKGMDLLLEALPALDRARRAARAARHRRRGARGGVRRRGRQRAPAASARSSATTRRSRI